jgi:hypothetical protein
MNTRPLIRRLRGAVLGSLGALLLAGQALAADDAQARYQQERAACMSGHSHQDQATCLKEAGAARAEARRGSLDTAKPVSPAARCDVLTGEQHIACIARMNGAGVTSGSVEGGGIYRELTYTVPPAGEANAPPPATTRQPPARPGS